MKIQMFRVVLLISATIVAKGLKLPPNSEMKYQDFNAGVASSRQQDKYTDILSNDIQMRQRLRNFVPPVIKTKDGKIRGLKVEITEAKLSDVVQYLGIPYAVPPVGNLRWKKPQTSQTWRGVKNVTKMGPVCPQSLNGNLPNVLIPQWYKNSNPYRDEIMKNMDEDCLYLNIYVPAKFYLREQGHPEFYRDPLPVMVYIHGHTFSDGSGNLYDGSALASYGDVIVVTINYRLGVLGFLSTSDSNCPGNYGLWDQIKALQWISKNIAAFGGDKTRVTLFGSGSGGASINLLMCSVQSDHSFARAILQSGTALAPWVIVRRPRQQARQFSRSPKINCYDTSDANIVKCLRGKTWRNLIEVRIQTDIYNLAFGPVVDGVNGVLTEEPSKLMEKGEYLNFPILIGVSQGEGYGFVKNNIDTSDKSESAGKLTADRSSYTINNFQLDVVNFIDSYYGGQRMKRVIESIVEFQYNDWSKKYGINKYKHSLLDMYTDKQWVEPMVRAAVIQSTYKYPVHFYTFNYRAQDASIPDWVEAGHGDELPFVFGAPLLPRTNNKTFQYNFTNTDRMIASAVMTYWTNFVKNGDPMVGTLQKNSFSTVVSNEFQDVNWVPFDLETRKHIKISEDPCMSDHYRANTVALWSSFLPSLMARNDRLCSSTNIKSNPFLPASPSNSYNPRVTPRTTTWTPKPGMTNIKNNGAVYYDAKSEGGISLQLSITLAIGFVLLFINIIAFAVVSYHKEKDKYKIEKLQNQLKTEKLKREAIDHNANKSSGLSRKEIICEDINEPRVIDVPARDNGTNIHRYAYTLPRKAPPTRAYSVSALPLVNPTIPRRDSFTSSGAQFSDDYLHHTTGRSLKWKQLNGGNFKQNFDDLSGSNYSKTLSSGTKEREKEIERDDTYRTGGPYNAKTIQPNYTNNRCKTMPSRGIPSVVTIIKPSSPEKVNARSSFSTLPTSSFCRTNRTFSSENSQPSEVNGFTNANKEPPLHNFGTNAFPQNTQSATFQKDITCNTQLPLLISPINEKTRNATDTPGRGSRKT